jgi:hypothetical protein
MSLSTSRRMRPLSAPAAACSPIAPPIEVPSQYVSSMPSWSISDAASFE